MNRQAWIEINLHNLRNNYHNIEKRLEKNTSILAGATGIEFKVPKIAGVVKANAYGCGAEMCAKTLVECGCEILAVATVKEAIQLRRAGIACRIILLGIAPEDDMDEIVEYDLCPVISSLNGAKVVDEMARTMNRIMECTIAVDSGMGRIGWQAFSGIEKAEERLSEHALSEIKEISEMKNLKIITAFSHLAVADEVGNDEACQVSIKYTRKQIKAFNDFCDEIEKFGVNLRGRSIANSSAIIEYPEAMLDFVRPGIILYGDYPSRSIDKTKLSISPIMSVKAEIVHLKTIEAGATVGYGRRFKAGTDRKIATLPIGYADGYSRILSGKAQVLIKGMRVPVIGNICMDQCMIDVTDIPDVKLGDEVIIMGEDEFGNRITADALAELQGTINYEVLCSFGMRLPHKYVDK